MEFQKLQRIIADVLNISEDKITPESTFVDDLKADSLDVFQIITEIKDQQLVMLCHRFRQLLLNNQDNNRYGVPPSITA